MKKRPVNWGGVFRCCESALAQEREEHQEGDVLHCSHCPYGFRLNHGEWIGLDAPDGYRGCREERT